MAAGNNNVEQRLDLYGLYEENGKATWVFPDGERTVTTRCADFNDPNTYEVPMDDGSVVTVICPRINMEYNWGVLHEVVEFQFSNGWTLKPI